MQNRRSILDFPRNEAGLVDEFIGTAFDAVYQVYIHLTEVINSKNNAERAEAAQKASEAAAAASIEAKQSANASALSAAESAANLAEAVSIAVQAENEAALSASAAAASAEIARLYAGGLLPSSGEAPIVRVDGTPLQVGDRYFNTVEQVEYVFTSTGWSINESLAGLAAIHNQTDPAKGAVLVGVDDTTVAEQVLVSRKLSSLQALRNYAGPATRFEITSTGQSGIFRVDPIDLESPDDNGTVVIDRSGRRVKRDFSGPVRPEMFGAKCNGSINPLSGYFNTLAEAQRVFPHATTLDCSIDWAATQAAINYIRSLPLGGTVVFSNRPVISHGIDCHPSVPVELCWEEGCTVYTTLLGASSILFKGTHPTTPSIRGKRLVLTNPDIAYHSSIPGSAVGCLFVEHRYASNFKIQGNRGTLLHYRNNTVLRLSGLFNCDAGPVSVWGGGVQKAWKVLSAARYSIASGTVALSSSIDAFEAADVGKVLVLQGSGLSQRFTIASFVDARNVTVSAAATATFTAIGGNFETIRGTITSGSTTLTMERACLDSSDIGRVVYVLNARTSFPSPAIEPLRATITAVTSSTVCTLSVAASVTANNTTVIFSPGVELFGEDGASSNDFVFDGLHTEEMRGTSLVVTRADNMSLTNLKLHALNNFYTTSATQHRAVFAAVSGHITGDFEGTCNTPTGDVHISGQAGLLTFDKMTGTMANDGCLVYAENNSAGAVVSVGDWNINNPGITAKTLDNAFRIIGQGNLYQKGNIVAYAFNYTRPDISRRKRVFGKNPPLLVGQVGAASDSSDARFDLIAAGSSRSPLLVGTAYGGSFEAPADAADYQTTLSIKGTINVGNNIIDGAGILFRARSPSGNEAASDIQLYTRTGGIYASRWSVATTGGLIPSADNVTPIGSASARVSQIYAGTATINTSDERFKGEVQAIWDDVLDAWSTVEYQQYKFTDAIEQKQDGARWHFGVIAQRIKEAFEEKGLDAFSFGVLCHDHWDEEPEVIETWDDELDNDGNVIRPAGSVVVNQYRPAGDRYGVRYEEALALEAALMRRTTERLHSRINALEALSR